MIVQPIDYFLVAWFVVALISTAYVAWNQFRNNPEPTVMRIAFILVTLYLGPFGLLIMCLPTRSRGLRRNRLSDASERPVRLYRSRRRNSTPTSRNLRYN